MPPIAFCRGRHVLPVQLKWVHQSQFAGFYVAEEEGYYRSEGLDVHLVKGGPYLNVQKVMSAGTVPIGVTTPLEIIKARSMDVPITAIAAIDQQSPIVWFSLKGSGIKDPRQFRGKKVVVSSTGRLHFIGMMKKIGLSRNEIKVRPFSLNLRPLYDGKVDVWSGYYTNLVVKAEEEGYSVNIIDPMDYGVQIYDDVIWVRQDWLKDHVRDAGAFIRATLRGWSKAIRDPGLAVKDTMRYVAGSSAEHQKALLQHSIPFIYTGEVPVGWMEPSVWNDICSLASQAGIEVAGECSAAYDDRFVRDYYGEMRK